MATRQFIRTARVVLFALPLASCGARTGLAIEGSDVAPGGPPNCDPLTRHWSAVQSLNPDAADSIEPQLAVDGVGNILRAWKAPTMIGTYALWSSWYLVETAKWTSPEQLPVEIAVGEGPWMEMSDSGDAVIAWLRLQGNDWALWGIRCASRTRQWTSAASLGPADEQQSFPSLSIDDAGNALISWRHLPTLGQSEVWIAHFRASDETWKAGLFRTFVQPAESAVATNYRGGGVVVWLNQDVAHQHELWASHYSADTDSWGRADRLREGATDIRFPSVRVNSADDASVVWSEHPGSGDSVWTARYDGLSGSWEPAHRVHSTADFVESVRMAAAVDSGGVWVTWQQRSDQKINTLPFGRCSSARAGRQHSVPTRTDRSRRTCCQSDR